MPYPWGTLADAHGDDEVQDGNDVVFDLSNSAPEPLHLCGESVAVRLGHIVQALQQPLRPASCRQAGQHEIGSTTKVPARRVLKY